MDETGLLATIIDIEAMLRKVPHVVAGVAFMLLVLWIAERPAINKFLNPHREELESIFATLAAAGGVSGPEAEVAKGAMLFGAIVRVGFMLALAVIVCWA